MLQNKISAILITGNEEENIRDCLESIKWADEIIVVDSESTDKTVEIAKEYTDNIFIKKWEGFGKQYQFALDQATNEWVFNLDADEEAPKNFVIGYYPSIQMIHPGILLKGKIICLVNI